MRRPKHNSFCKNLRALELNPSLQRPRANRGYIRENAIHLQQVRAELQPSQQLLSPRHLPSSLPSPASSTSRTPTATSRSPQLLLPWPALIPPPHLGVPSPGAACRKAACYRRQDFCPRKIDITLPLALPLELETILSNLRISNIELRQRLHWLKDQARKGIRFWKNHWLNLITTFGFEKG
jgi:hypothetical protein